MMDQVKELVQTASLGYALMTVMDDDDLGRGPKMERQTINLRDIDENFMRSFIRGVNEQGLQNRYMNNAIDIGVRRKDIDVTSLRSEKQGEYNNHVRWAPGATESTSILYNGNHRVTYMQEHSAYCVIYAQYRDALKHLDKTGVSANMLTAYADAADKASEELRKGAWLVRFLDLGTYLTCSIDDLRTLNMFEISDLIREHEDQILMEHHLAANRSLIAHDDSDNDSLQQTLNIMLNVPVEQLSKYISSLLQTATKISTSSFAKVLKDKEMLLVLLDLFKYEHFRSRDNKGTSLSMRNIAKFYPVIGGVSEPFDAHSVDEDRR